LFRLQFIPKSPVNNGTSGKGKESSKVKSVPTEYALDAGVLRIRQLLVVELVKTLLAEQNGNKD